MLPGQMIFKTPAAAMQKFVENSMRHLRSGLKEKMP